MEQKLDSEVGIVVHCNWIRLCGADYKTAIQTEPFNEDVFIKPELPELLKEDKALLLGIPTENFEDPCEMNVKTNGRFKIAAVSLVCSSPKIELFLSNQYEETIYGTIINDEIDGEELAEGDEMIRTYRYDFEVNKSGITDISVKFITQKKELCIFGFLMFIAPNPNGMTTLSPQSINLDVVEEMLKTSNHKLSTNAEKCKLFLESYQKNQGHLLQSSINPARMVEFLRRDLERTEENNSNTVTSHSNHKNEDVIKSYIDLRLKEMEKNFETRLENLHKSQNEKLDKIIELISKKL